MRSASSFALGWVQTSAKDDLRDFLRELGRLMPKGRVWREGQALTVYGVLASEVVPIAQRKRA